MKEIDLILSLGSNLGDKKTNLNNAKNLLTKHFDLVEESPIATSKAVDYIQQPDFYNQVLHFKAQSELITPNKTLKLCQAIENDMGRKRLIKKGPRIIDIDILFYSNLTLNQKYLTIPHAELFKRSFIVNPLKKLKIFQKLQTDFHFPPLPDNSCQFIGRQARWMRTVECDAGPRHLKMIRRRQ